MKVLVVDEARKRRARIEEALNAKKHSVTSCSGSGQFMEAVQEHAPDRVVLDIPSWMEGRAIYSYFGFSGRLAEMPVLFYNAPEGFTGLSGRKRRDDDYVMVAPTEPDDVAKVIEEQF